jgi:hypothetical protein
MIFIAANVSVMILLLAAAAFFASAVTYFTTN